MDNKTLTLGEAGSLLLGAGLVKLDTLTVGLTLIAVGAALKIAVAFLQKQGVQVSAKPDFQG